MNIALLTEPRTVAREKYAEYLRAVKERHSKEYVALKNAYRELSRGRQVIDIVDVIRTAGLDTQWRPKLAIIRADAKLCWFRWDGNQPLFAMHQWSDKKTDSVKLPEGTLAAPPNNWRNRSRAVVPSIPPRLIPDGKLSNYHILWEAEWERMPVDPMLLRHLGKNLYVVLAQWDLTPLERAVLQPMPTN